MFAVVRAMNALVRSVTGQDVREDRYDYYVIPGHREQGYVDGPNGKHIGFTDAAPAGQRTPLIPAGSKPVATTTLSHRHSYGHGSSSF